VREEGALNRQLQGGELQLFAGGAKLAGRDDDDDDDDDDESDESEKESEEEEAGEAGGGRYACG